jgi:DNA-binding NarL/FixJ family response regulator
MLRVIIITRREQDLRRIRTDVDAQEDLTVVGTGAGSYEAIKLAEAERPDIAVIAYRTDDDEPDVISFVKSISPGTSIVLISSGGNGKQIMEALFKGVSGYLLWNADLDILVSIIYAVQGGGYYISQRIMLQIFRLLSDFPGAGKLTGSLFSGGLREDGFPQPFSGAEFPLLNQTELRIRELIKLGKTTKEISEILKLRIGSVRNCISTMLRKNGVHSRLDLICMSHICGPRQFKTGGNLQKDRRPVAGAQKTCLPLLEARLNLKG